MGIAVDLYHKTKGFRFRFPIFGWSCMVIASLASLYVGLITNNDLIELFLFFNTLFVSLGIIFFIWWIFTYFLEVPNRVFYFLLISMVFFLIIIFYATNYRLAINFAVSIVIVMLSSLYVIPFLKWKEFKASMGIALKWYYAFLISLGIHIPITLYITFQGLGYQGIRSSYDLYLIFFNFVPSILYSIVLIILLIHVEYNYSYNQKAELKDKYSHDLGNILQFITGYMDVASPNDELNDKEKLELKNTFKVKCKEAADLLKEIREL
ncbi:MAG: hypothetical protein EU539_07550 [Promethearchaeota archaeon]|nr:MAG: hypothetical protein EU539_07550 [Candidatus Lokiarchaeota archaeon]